MMTGNYLKQLNGTYEQYTKLMEQSDGSKLHRPSDDSVAYSKYLRYQISDNENTQYQENVDTAVSWMKTSDAALVNMTDIQTTFKEKTVGAANDTNNTNDMQAIAKEIEREDEKAQQYRRNYKPVLISRRVNAAQSVGCHGAKARQRRTDAHSKEG